MASSLSLRTALTSIEQALHRVIRWKLLKLTATVPTPAALRGVPTLGAGGTNSVSAFRAVYVTSLAKRVEWSIASSATDDGTTVFKPNDRASNLRGRWLITESTETGGYLTAVNFWDGETSREQFQARISAARPSVAILWEKSKNDPRSNIPGAIYDYTVEFTIWCIDENLRPRYEALFGSDLSSDSAHPGVIAILGDVKKALADQNKRVVDQDDDESGPLSLGGGVKVVAIGAETMEDADLDGRVMIMGLGVTVYASVENPDSSGEHVAVTSVYGAPKLTALNQQTEFDQYNYVINGFQFEVQSSLTATPSAGSAILSGAVVSGAPSATTFTEYQDTYCDLSASGTLSYVAVANNFAEPDLTSGMLRVGMVTTDSIGITAYQPIAATSYAFGSGWRAVPYPNRE
jgi:hypothetical protein